MASTLTQVNNYISSIRSGVADFADDVCRDEMLGHTDTFCNRQKLVLASAYMDCIVDYFQPFIDVSGATPYTTSNFFTTDEIRDVMQHLNNVCGTFYMIEL